MAIRKEGYSAGGYRRDTLREAGMKYIGCLETGEHILEDIDTGKRELWFSGNRYHAGYGIIFKNTVLEFARTATESDLARLL